MRTRKYNFQSNDYYGRALIRYLIAGVILCVGSVLVTSCGVQNASQQNSSEEGKKYASGDGAVTEYSPEQREASVNFSGTMIGDKPFSLEQERGRVVVLNFWYAACPPCRKEAPALEETYQQFKFRNVNLVGINIRDEEATATAFIEKFGISYPNIIDKDGGVLQPLSQFVPGRSIPTTLILDRQGRVAARVLGATDQATLKGLITAIMEEA